MSAKGEINLAPYSFFNGVSSDPPEFVYSLATWDLRSQVNATSGPFSRGVNEMEETGLEPAGTMGGVRPAKTRLGRVVIYCSH